MKIFFSKKIKRRFSKRLRERLEFNYVIAIVITLLFGLFIFSLINLLTIFRLRQDLLAAQTDTTVSIDTPINYYEDPIDKVVIPDAVNVQMSSSTNSSSTEITTPTSEPTSGITSGPTSISTSTEITTGTTDRSGWKYNVFGDGFSNSYYVDMSKTNFHYDDMATAFYFSPSYEKVDKGACSQAFCGFSKEQKSKFCLAKNNKLCVSWDGEKLNYNGAEVEAFTTLFAGGLKPSRVSIYPLKNYWLVGAVWTENGQEIGRAWRFDGKKLVALDPQNRIPFTTRQGYSGSNIYFGGDDSSYIVLYSGYDISGYQVVNNTLWNISDFFNTRLADSGFAPQIIKHQQGAETVWYICSATDDKPKLIKMWQNGSRIIRGLLSLGDDLFAGGYSSALCREGSDGNLEIATAKKNGGAVNYNRWTLIDKGFDESHDYQAVSVNLSSGKGRMKMANFGGLSICGADSCGGSAFKNSLNFFVTDNSNNWRAAAIGQEYLFTDPGSSLMWKLEAPSDTNKSYYSPWFGAINSVYYAWVEQGKFVLQV